ncbi:MAG: histidine--tRNA ligase [Thermodesulfobacteriota bacterium]|nr:histidine--tRNA ligase [Thermodesulfobacteriota bacterium]
MIKSIKGMNDILPDAVHKWHSVEGKARHIFELYGFSEIRTPLLEQTELFARTIGEDTDIVGKEMYTFVDKSDTSVTLRPEATASVLRAVIEHSLLNQDSIQKLYSMGPMFRYERPQKGRYRQFYQINVERMGEAGPFCDAETIAMAYELVDAIGLKNITLEVNSLGCQKCRPVFRKQLKEFLQEKRDMLCKDCSRRIETNPLRVFDCKEIACQEAIKDAPRIEDHLCDACRRHFNDLLQTLDALGIPFHKAPRLVRGLDYYVRTTFEIKAEGLGTQNAVAGGGRYDGLVKALGGPDVPGIGFAFGMERAIMLMKEAGPVNKGCFVVIQGGREIYRSAMALISDMRSSGLQAQAIFEKSMKSQMKRADKLGYLVCAIIGETEVAKDMVTIRDMRTSSQVQVKRALAINKIKEMLA